MIGCTCGSVTHGDISQALDLSMRALEGASIPPGARIEGSYRPKTRLNDLCLCCSRDSLGAYRCSQSEMRRGDRQRIPRDGGRKRGSFARGTESSNPCTLQSGYWLVGIVDWPDRAGLPGVAHESPCFEHLERTCSSTLQAPRRIFTLPARHGELSGPNRVRLSPRCGAGETVKPLMRAPDEVPGSCRPASVLAE